VEPRDDSLGHGRVKYAHAAPLILVQGGVCVCVCVTQLMMVLLELLSSGEWTTIQDSNPIF